MSSLDHKLMIYLDQDAEPSELLEEFIENYKDRIHFITEAFQNQEKLFLSCKEGRIGFLYGRQNMSFVDWSDAALLKRFAQTSTKEIFIQALTSKRTKYKVLWDMTAGFGTDSFIASRYFESVVMVERNPIVYLLLQDGLMRALRHEKASKFASKVTLICSEASAVMGAFASSDSANLHGLSVPKPDVIYFDFMFENKKTQSSKMMELLRLLESDYDKAMVTKSNISEMISMASEIKEISRVVMKAKELPDEVTQKPSQIFEGKVVNYYQF